MQKNRLSSLLGLSLASLLGACLGAPSDSTEEVANVGDAVTTNGVTANLSITSDWGAGYCASVALQNTSTKPVTTWQVVLETKGATLNQLWNGSYTTSGTLVTVSPMSFNAALPAAGSGSFGFCGTGASRPSIVSLSVTGGQSSSSTTSGGATSTTSVSASSSTSGSGGATSGTSTTAGSGGATSGSSTSSGSGGATAGAKWVGNITTSGAVRSDFNKFWNQITPENEGKWGSVESQHNVMNWSGLDRVHDYAKQHGIKFKQHNLVWGAQQPSWLTGMSAAQQAAEVKEWIQLFCQRYPDVDLIDVVNEPPPHTTPVYADALGGAGSSGYDWIVQSFKWARQFCPNATLILNDYNNIEYASENSHFIDIVNKIKAAGAPIDAIGAQAHDAYKLPTATVQGLMNKLAATGLPIYISEYDIDLADDTQQKNVMQSEFTMFYNDPHVKGITIWGYIVGATWKPNTGLMTSAGVQRPAMTWLMSFLGR